MKRIISLSILFLILFVSISSVIAVSQDELNQAKTLIDSNISCDKLANDQLEIIGEYYMEQMHPGETHELMHKMMGLTEGSEAEKQFHINMAKTIYCGEPGGMMGMMSGGNMMNMMSGNGTGGMMGNSYYQNTQNSNSYQNNFIVFQIFFYVVFVLVVIILILIILLLINKLKKQGGNNRHGRG